MTETDTEFPNQWVFGVRCACFLSSGSKTQSENRPNKESRGFSNILSVADAVRRSGTPLGLHTGDEEAKWQLGRRRRRGRSGFDGPFLYSRRRRTWTLSGTELGRVGVRVTREAEVTDRAIELTGAVSVGVYVCRK